MGQGPAMTQVIAQVQPFVRRCRGSAMSRWAASVHFFPFFFKRRLNGEIGHFQPQERGAEEERCACKHDDCNRRLESFGRTSSDAGGVKECPGDNCVPTLSLPGTTVAAHTPRPPASVHHPPGRLSTGKWPCPSPSCQAKSSKRAPNFSKTRTTSP